VKEVLERGPWQLELTPWPGGGYSELEEVLRHLKRLGAEVSLEWNLREDAVLERRAETLLAEFQTGGDASFEFFRLAKPDMRDAAWILAEISTEYLEATGYTRFEEAMEDIAREVENSFRVVYDARLFRGRKKVAEFTVELGALEDEDPRILQAVAWELAWSETGIEELRNLVAYPEPEKRPKPMPEDPFRFALALPLESHEDSYAEIALPAVLLDEAEALALLELKNGKGTKELPFTPTDLLYRDLGPVALEARSRGEKLWEALKRGTWTRGLAGGWGRDTLTAWREGDEIHFLAPWEEETVWARVEVSRVAQLAENRA